jgi:hypothetical protein
MSEKTIALESLDAETLQALLPDALRILDADGECVLRCPGDELQRANNEAEQAFRGRKRAWKRGWNQVVARMFRGLSAVSLALLVLILTGCSLAAPSAEQWSGETEPVASAEPVAVSFRSAPPAPLLADPPDAAPPPVESPDYAAMRDAGACLLPVRYAPGDCACGYGLACFDSCSRRRDGVLVVHAFCVDGGL